MIPQRRLVVGPALRQVLPCDKCGGTFESGRYAYHCRFSKHPMHAKDKRVYGEPSK